MWFYYGTKETKCLSPVDNDISTMIIFYFIIVILLLIPTINTCLNRSWAFCYVKTMIALYLLAKMTLLLIMLINIQLSYDNSWKKNICDNLENLTALWLIWNYVAVILTVLYFVCFIGVACCECDYYDEYDYYY